MVLLARNKVRDYDHWRRVFDEQGDAARAAGLHLIAIWRSVDDPDDAFFMFSVEDRGRAEAFMHSPDSIAAGQRAGVIGGEYHFLQVDKE